VFEMVACTAAAGTAGDALLAAVASIGRASTVPVSTGRATTFPASAGLGGTPVPANTGRAIMAPAGRPD